MPHARTKPHGWRSPFARTDEPLLGICHVIGWAMALRPAVLGGGARCQAARRGQHAGVRGHDLAGNEAAVRAEAPGLALAGWWGLDVPCHAFAMSPAPAFLPLAVLGAAQAKAASRAWRAWTACAAGLGLAGCASDIQYQQISAPQEPLMYELRTDSLKAVDGAARRLCPKGHQVLSTAESGQLKSRWFSLPESTELVWIVRCDGDLATWKQHPRLQAQVAAKPSARSGSLRGGPATLAPAASTAASAASAPASGPRVDEFGVIHF